MKVRWKFIIGVAVSAAFLIYALSQVDYAEVVQAFSSASYIWAIPMMFSVMIAMAIRAIRWRYLLNPIQSFSISTLFSSILIGFMANNLLPARLGEVVRAVSLSKKPTSFINNGRDRCSGTFLYIFTIRIYHHDRWYCLVKSFYKMEKTCSYYVYSSYSIFHINYGLDI